MKPQTTFLFLALLCSSSLFSQTPTIVGMAPFEWNQRTADPTYVSMIYDHISFLLANNSGIQLVSRDEGWEQIQEERDLIKTEPFILTETIQQGRSKGAEKLLVGKVYLTEIRRQRDGFSASFSLYLGVVDVESGIVEDNIMVSPRGLEDSDKMIKVLLTMQRFQFLPRNIFFTRFLGALELFDLFATYNIGGVTQDDSFRESLNQLDQIVIPFLEYHFNGVTDNYTPRMDRNKTPIRDSKEPDAAVARRASQQQTSRGGGGKGPIKLKLPGSKEPEGGEVLQSEEDLHFMYVENFSGNLIRIYGGELNGIKPSTKLSLITAEDKVTTSLNGETFKGEEIVDHGELKFERYEGDFSIFSMNRKEPIDIHSLLNDLNENTRLYLAAEKIDRGPFKEERKFSVVEMKGDNQLLIAGNMVKDGLKKNAQFSLVKETVKTFHDPNGEVGAGIVREEMATFKLEEDRNDFLLIEMNKGADVSIQELLGERRTGERYFILNKLHHY